MNCTPGELDMLKRFAAVYERAMTPTMKAIERKVCGCDYGGNSWLSRAQADDLGARLGLGPAKRLLDLGAGSGWPAIYLANTFGCQAMLVDLPEIGLRIAQQRAAADGIAERIETLVADAADLPFAAESFDAVSHCDLLCCLVQKRLCWQIAGA
jgi:cyclopropane fatty-acyl-phospholipid synthase-like methyltransferase